MAKFKVKGEGGVCNRLALGVEKKGTYSYWEPSPRKDHAYILNGEEGGVASYGE